MGDSVPVDVDKPPYWQYGKLPWSDRKRMRGRYVAMEDHGGRSALIDLEDGSALAVFSPGWAIKALFD